jgi:hypothetical protein
VRRIALIAATLAVLSGCGGEAKTKATQPERAAEADWRPSAERACGQLTEPLVARAWFMNLKEMRRRLPVTVRDVRQAVADTARLPGRPDQQFVADMGALDPRLAALRRAGRSMKVGRLDRAITRLEKKLSAVAKSARRAGLRECVTRKQVRRIVNSLRAPVAAEQVRALVVRNNKRQKAAGSDPSAGAKVWAEQDAAIRKLKVPAWARRERAAWRRAARHYMRGIEELAERNAAGLYTPDAQYDELIDDRLHAANRKLRKLYDAMGAHPTGPRS